MPISVSAANKFGADIISDRFHPIFHVDRRASGPPFEPSRQTLFLGDMTIFRTNCPRRAKLPQIPADEDIHFSCINSLTAFVHLA
jgi:hypothetical protein